MIKQDVPIGIPGGQALGPGCCVDDELPSNCVIEGELQAPLGLLVTHITDEHVDEADYDENPTVAGAERDLQQTDESEDGEDRHEHLRLPDRHAPKYDRYTEPEAGRA